MKNWNPETTDAFDRYFSGEVQPRPKILIHPETKKYYRLVPPNITDGTPSFYHELNVQPTTIHFYTMDELGMERYRQMELPSLPAGYTMRQLTLQPDARTPLKPNEISCRQLYELMIALGNDSGWWPVEDSNYRAEDYFGKKRLNILFRDNLPVAVHMWDESKLEETGEILGSFIATTPDSRGQGLGGYIIKWGLKELANRGCNKYYLDTGDDDMMNGKQGLAAVTARSYYERLGFHYSHSETVDPHDVNEFTTARHGIPIHLCKLNIGDDYFRHPHTGATLGQYTDSVIRKRLERAFAPSRSEPLEIAS